MIKIFNKYLIKRSFYFSFFILMVFGVLDSIFIFISELENASQQYDIFSILGYVIYSLPHNLIDFIEGACLLGVMLSLGLSHQEGNLNVLRSAGEPPLRIILMSSIGALILTMSLLALDEISFRNLYLNAEVNKNILSKKDNSNNNDIKWIKSGNSYLSFENIISDDIYQAKLIKIDKKEIAYSIQSDTAFIDNKEIVFNENSNYKNFKDKENKNYKEQFEIPIQSRITFNNISNLGLYEISAYRNLFKESNIDSDILFKSHLDKAFYKLIFLPISILILIIYFGSLIFTSLRESTVGGRIIVAVLGAFLFKLFQDLSIGIFISYSLPVFIGVILPSVILALMSISSYKKI